MSNALLLRLFLSSSYFSINVALQYLSRYYDNIGITYYLTRRLREFRIDELRDVWGFLCHLLLTRPSKSRALECFIVDTCERSTHMALFTLWFMQAHLRDVTSLRNDTGSFAICQRVLHRCHEIIFEDAPGLVNGPYANMKVISRRLTSRRRVKFNFEPAIIGISCVLAGAPGMPLLTEEIGEVAVEQGRVDPGFILRGIETGGEDSTLTKFRESYDTGDDKDDEDQGSDEKAGTSPDGSLRDVDKTNFRKPLSQAQKIREAAQTSPALTSLDGIRRSEATDDPFGQRISPSSSILPSRSSPVIPTSRRVPTTGSGNTVDNILQIYDNVTQRQLLQGHYCRSEVQFILALENISNRLLVIPKPARVSALRAELTSLNHKLPAEVCLPMWCPGVESSLGPKTPVKAHHRIVRIPPGESVVLNSAERAPYLLLIEVLTSDLDFDTAKRGNRELLKEIIQKDLRSMKPPGENFSLTTPSSTTANDVLPPILSAENVLDPEAADSDSAGLEQNLTLSPTEGVKIDMEDEEVDLVEQVYGGDLSVHQTPDLSETYILPTPPKNRALDIATWTRASSLPSSPAVTPSVSATESFPNTIHRTDSSLPYHTESRGHAPTASGSGRLNILSIDDYSERMRTAAVMLAQLNTSLVKESVTQAPQVNVTSPVGVPPSEPGSSWLPMKNWLSGVQTDSTPGPLHPSLSGKIQDPTKNPQAVGSSRMKLQPSEVADIRERIMQEMLALEEERMGRMQAVPESLVTIENGSGGLKTLEDEQIIRRELNRADPSSIVFQESWAAKKSRIRQGSPYGHLAAWDCMSVIVKTGGDLRQEQLAVQLIQEFEHIWSDENCQCWVRPFRIVITGGSSGLVETITDAVSIHSIKKVLYARRLAEGRLGQVTLLDHFRSAYGDPSSAKFARAQRNFVRSLAGYSIVTYLLQIKDRHNGNILLDRDGHLIHIDFGFMLSNSPGNIGFEAAPFKLTFDYVEVMGGVDSPMFREFKRLFHEGFEAVRKHCDRIAAIVELMQKGEKGAIIPNAKAEKYRSDSSLPCFAALGVHTAQQLRERFQPKTNQQPAEEHIERLIMTSLGSNWTRLYDSYQYYSQSIL